MASGFSGGGAPDFFTGRSIATTTMTNQPPQIPYRSQLPGIFLDPSAQIARQTHGKRSLADFQTQQFHNNNNNQGFNNNNNQGFNSFFLRSAKRGNYQITSPISPLSPIDISQDTSLLSSSQQRFSLPMVQQLRPNSFRNNNMALQGVQYAITRPVQNRVPSSTTQELSEQKMINHTRLQEMENHRLQELEKQLLDDDDDVNGDDNDAVSVITANSEWSETIQNLMSPTQKPISPSPTSSSSSSSSSSSVASPGSACLKQSLMEAATNIYEGKNDAAAEILTRLAQFSNPKGKPEERLMSYMVSTLKSRANPIENRPPVLELFDKEHAESTRFLYEMSPCFKFGFIAANLAIVEATLEEKSDNENKIHVIDFEFGQGGEQYLHLLQALSARRDGKPTIVKITSVALSADNDGEEEERVHKFLSQEAENLGVKLRFKAVVSHRLDELTRESLGCEPDEPLAVNFAFNLHRMADESVSMENPRDELLRRVKGLAPRVVTLVEQEMNTNTAPFSARVGETCTYYGALFESMEATILKENPRRVKVEEGLSRRLANSVACEGRDRLERCEVFGKWRARMGMAGFELKPLSQNVAESLKARLSSSKRVINQGFTVKEENGGVGFGWMGRTLTVASAWR